ncbi:MAG TPA: phosphotransferase [Candidatus Sulfopaludibacter sp.]|nr:phosphotransferase [Candidatus Sulfopaludibacter sp.]
MNEPDSFLELLRRDGIVRSPAARLAPLSGGVSCEIYLVEDGAERFVVKRALAKLKVKADWLADVGRNRHEWEYIRYVARFLPEAVPVLRDCSATDHYFTMEYLNGRFLNWKQLLLAGTTNAAHARHAGNVLAQIHRHSAGDAEARRLFDTTPVFFQLRIEPFLLTTGAEHPALLPLFEAEAARLGDARECLVHGDFSPKNIMINGDRLVVLDCEVAWYGDPAFDVAFLLNHLSLKALRHAPRDAGVRPMLDEFWSAYQAARPCPEIELRVGRLLLMLMLARVDGKSPVEYLDVARQQFVRDFVGEQLPRGNFALRTITDLWFSRLAQLGS